MEDALHLKTSVNLQAQNTIFCSSWFLRAFPCSPVRQGRARVSSTDENMPKKKGKKQADSSGSEDEVRNITTLINAAVQSFTPLLSLLGPLALCPCCQIGHPRLGPAAGLRLWYRTVARSLMVKNLRDSIVYHGFSKALTFMCGERLTVCTLPCHCRGRRVTERSPRLWPTQAWIRSIRSRSYISMRLLSGLLLRAQHRPRGGVVAA